MATIMKSRNRNEASEAFHPLLLEKTSRPSSTEERLADAFIQQRLREAGLGASTFAEVPPMTVDLEDVEPLNPEQEAMSERGRGELLGRVGLRSLRNLGLGLGWPGIGTGLAALDQAKMLKDLASSENLEKAYEKIQPVGKSEMALAFIPIAGGVKFVGKGGKLVKGATKLVGKGGKATGALKKVGELAAKAGTAASKTKQAAGTIGRLLTKGAFTIGGLAGAIGIGGRYVVPWVAESLREAKRAIKGEPSGAELREMGRREAERAFTQELLEARNRQLELELREQQQRLAQMMYFHLLERQMELNRLSEAEKQRARSELREAFQAYTERYLDDLRALTE